MLSEAYQSGQEQAFKDAFSKEAGIVDSVERGAKNVKNFYDKSHIEKQEWSRLGKDKKRFFKVFAKGAANPMSNPHAELTRHVQQRAGDTQALRIGGTAVAGTAAAGVGVHELGKVKSQDTN